MITYTERLMKDLEEDKLKGKRVIEYKLVGKNAVLSREERVFGRPSIVLYENGNIEEMELHKILGLRDWIVFYHKINTVEQFKKAKEIYDKAVEGLIKLLKSS